jgi:hypothetical protein
MAKVANDRSDAMKGKEREPALDEILTDPVTQAVMASDGVAAKDIKTLLEDARRRYGSEPSRTRS